MSRHILVYIFAIYRSFQIILWNIFWGLMDLRPASHFLKIPTYMLCVEIGEGVRTGFIPPDLPKDADIDGAHELLAKDV